MTTFVLFPFQKDFLPMRAVVAHDLKLFFFLSPTATLEDFISLMCIISAVRIFVAVQCLLYCHVTFLFGVDKSFFLPCESPVLACDLPILLHFTCLTKINISSYYFEIYCVA